jgi:hypothetical protein
VKRIPPKLALPWILEADWPQWQSVDNGVPNYGKWVELFDKNLKLAESYGWPYERVEVRPDRFNEWCQANQRTVGKFDRSLYALELLRKNQIVSPDEMSPDDISLKPGQLAETVSQIEPAGTSENHGPKLAPAVIGEVDLIAAA